MTGAELFNIIGTYAELGSSRMELFVAGAVAMIVAGFVTKTH